MESLNQQSNTILHVQINKYSKRFQNTCFCSDLSVKNLRFLSSEQALADLATFTVAMKEQYNFTVSYYALLLN